MLQASQYLQTGNQASLSDTSQKSTQFCLVVCFISQAARYTCVQMALLEIFALIVLWPVNEQASQKS